MSGKKKRNTSVDSGGEYQYTEEGAGNESFTDSPAKAMPSIKVLVQRLLEQLPKQKRFRFLLFLFIAIFVVYKFLSANMPVDSPKLSAEKMVAQQLTKSVVSPPPPASAVDIGTKPSPATPATDPLKELSFSANAPVEPSSGAMLKEIQGSLQYVSRSVAVIESSLVNLTGSVIRLSDKVKTLEKFRQEEKHALMVNPLLTYSLRALVLGRAWLESSVGELISVKVGDVLPGYGQIARIDVSAGNLATTSGRMIEYGPNDS